MSNRDLPAALADEIAKVVLQPVLGIFVDLPDPVHVCTLPWAIRFPDAAGIEREWIGGGDIGSISGIDEGTDGSAGGIRLTLNDIPIDIDTGPDATDIRSYLDQQATKDATIEIYVAVTEEDHRTVISSKLFQRYRLDTWSLLDSGDELQLEIGGESRMRDQGRPAIKMFTDEYHRAQHPGDLFFQYVAQMAEVQVMWAAAAQGAGVASSGYSGGGGSGTGSTGGQHAV